MRAKVGGAEVDYLVSGSGPALVLVHGTGGSAAATWDGYIERFAAHRTVIAPDYAGSGATIDHGARLQLSELVDQVSGAAFRAGQERYDLVGFSLGAVVAAALAARDPEQIASLVLIAGWPSSDNGRVQLQFRLWEELHARDHRLFAKILALTGFSARFLMERTWSEIEELVAEMSSGFPAGMGRQAELNLRIDIRDQLSRITAPTLVVGCREDQMVPVQDVRRLHALIPGATYEEFDTGHLVIYEQPHELAQAIERFTGIET